MIVAERYLANRQRTLEQRPRLRMRWPPRARKRRSEVGRFCLGLRKQVLLEEIAVVLGADRFQHWAVELEPSPRHGERRLNVSGSSTLTNADMPLPPG